MKFFEHALVATMLLGGCAPPPHPMVADLQKLSGDQFRFVSTATMLQPLNTDQGEHARMVKLSSLLAENRMCPDGFVIDGRDPPRSYGQVAVDEYVVRDVVYVGRCKR